MILLSVLFVVGLHLCSGLDPYKDAVDCVRDQKAEKCVVVRTYCLDNRTNQYKDMLSPVQSHIRADKSKAVPTPIYVKKCPMCKCIYIPPFWSVPHPPAGQAPQPPPTSAFQPPGTGMPPFQPPAPPSYPFAPNSLSYPGAPGFAPPNANPQDSPVGGYGDSNPNFPPMPPTSPPAPATNPSSGPPLPFAGLF